MLGNPSQIPANTATSFNPAQNNYVTSQQPAESVFDHAATAHNTYRGYQVSRITCDQSKKSQLVRKKIKVINYIQMEKKDQGDNLKVDGYLDFLKKINYSNNLLVTASNPYKVFVGKGNNSIVIKNCVKSRWWLQLTENKDLEGIHFLWTQVRHPDYIKLLKPHQLQYPQPPSQHSSTPEQTPAKRLQLNPGAKSQDMNCCASEQGETAQTEDNLTSDSEADALARKGALMSKSNLPPGTSANGSLSGQKKGGSSGAQPQLQQLSSKIQSRSITPARKQKTAVQTGSSSNREKMSEEQLREMNQNLLKIMNKNDLQHIRNARSITQPRDFDQVSKQIKSQQLNVLGSATRKQHNHLENYWNLSNKKALFYNMRSYFTAQQKDVF